MIKRHENGIYAENSWVYTNPETKESILVDPGDDLDTLYNLINDTKVTHVFITHGHIDHIYGLLQVQEDFPNAIVVAHENAKETFTDPTKNLSHMMGLDIIANEPTWTYTGDTAKITAAGQEWTLVYTPGHACDHTIFLGQDGTCFGGDLIFEQGSMGRIDFPGSDPIKMRVSIARMLAMPDPVTVYPGHGNIFTIGEAKKYFSTLSF